MAESLCQLKTLALTIVPNSSLTATMQNLQCLLILALTDVVSLLQSLNMDVPSVLYETVHGICLERSNLIYQVHGLGYTVAAVPALVKNVDCFHVVMNGFLHTQV